MKISEFKLKIQSGLGGLIDTYFGSNSISDKFINATLKILLKQNIRIVPSRFLLARSHTIPIWLTFRPVPIGICCGTKPPRTNIIDRFIRRTWIPSIGRNACETSKKLAIRWVLVLW